MAVDDIAVRMAIDDIAIGMAIDDFAVGGLLMTLQLKWLLMTLQLEVWIYCHPDITPLILQRQILGLTQVIFVPRLLNSLFITFIFTNNQPSRSSSNWHVGSVEDLLLYCSR